MTKLFARFKKCQAGATAIEYGLIATFIALVIIVSVASIGSSLNTVFTLVASALNL